MRRGPRTLGSNGGISACRSSTPIARFLRSTEPRWTQRVARTGSSLRCEPTVATTSSASCTPSGAGGPTMMGWSRPSGRGRRRRVLDEGGSGVGRRIRCRLAGARLRRAENGHLRADRVPTAERREGRCSARARCCGGHNAGLLRVEAGTARRPAVRAAPVDHAPPPVGGPRRRPNPGGEVAGDVSFRRGDPLQAATLLEPHPVPVAPR